MMNDIYKEKANLVNELKGIYISLPEDELCIIYLVGEAKPKIYFGGMHEEYVVTKDNHLICVTMNSLSSIEKEMTLKRNAFGYVGDVEQILYYKKNTSPNSVTPE